MSLTMGNPFNVTEKEDYADISLFEFAFVCSTARYERHALGVFFFALCVKHISLNAFAHQKLDLPDGDLTFLKRALSKSYVS